METMAHEIYPTYYQALQSVLEQAERGELTQARQAVAGILESVPTLLEDPRDIQVLFFAEALRKRLDPEAEELGNLYLMPDAGQQIKAFSLMAEKFPVVRFSQEIVNEAILQEIRGESAITILDIGIGTGQQMVRLLEKACAGQPSLKQVTLVGIEPAAESLTQARSSLEELAQKCPIELTFEGFQRSAETMDEPDWQALASLLSHRQGKLIVNASFALHHIRPVSLRAALFARCKQFKPDLLTLIEPYADFLTMDTPARFAHAWHHYGLVFQAIDRIDALLEDKNRIKTLFFRREIQDVLADEPQRVERFETGEMWVTRLQEAGFTVERIGDAFDEIPNCPFVRLTRRDNFLTIDAEGYPLLAIMAAR